MVNIGALINEIRQLSNDPQQIFERYNIPKQYNSPESVMQYLINSGRVSQAQINQTSSLYRQIFNK